MPVVLRTEVLAAPATPMAWVCPECGHGSPEPRDQQAHLDAHAQLRRFLDDWDAAVARDRRTERRRKLRPALFGVLIVAAIPLTAGSLRLARPHDVVPPSAAGPAPVADQPVTVPAPVAAAEPDPPAVTSPEAPARAADPAAPTRARSSPPSAPATERGFTPPLAAAEPVAAAPPPAPAPLATLPAAPAARPAGLLIRGCVLSICLALGG